MTGPKQAGRPWTPAEERELCELFASGVNAATIARKLNRSSVAIYARVNSFESRQSTARSLPSERAIFYHKSSREKPGMIS